MRLRLLLTADYEVFGDGSGNVEACLIEPTRRLLGICDAAGARLTLFVEVCEYWAFQAARRDGRLPSGSDPAAAIERQLRNAVQRGHDVQLHFHPQWLESSFDPTTGWRIEPSLWRLPDVIGSRWYRASGGDLATLFRRGRDTLEEMLGDVAPGYRCTAFRAGAWCLQPEDAVLPAMAAAGLRVDSSVAPGARFDDGLTVYDFSAAPPELPYWFLDADLVTAAAQTTLVEMPIFTRPVGLAERGFWRVLRWLKRIRRYPSACRPADSGGVSAAGEKGGIPAVGDNRGLSAARRRAAASRVEMFGYCNVAAGQMKAFVRAARRRFAASPPDALIPVVAIGHPKEFANPAELEAFLAWVARQDDVELDAPQTESFFAPP